jgi:antitoxin component of MazEF toxin-antitoxin module
MSFHIRKTDIGARLALPKDFASCLVIVERLGDEILIRKAKGVIARRYTFRQLMASVTKKNIHAEVSTGRPVGREIM